MIIIALFRFFVLSELPLTCSKSINLIDCNIFVAALINGGLNDGFIILNAFLEIFVARFRANWKLFDETLAFFYLLFLCFDEMFMLLNVADVEKGNEKITIVKFFQIACSSSSNSRKVKKICEKSYLFWFCSNCDVVSSSRCEFFCFLFENVFFRFLIRIEERINFRKLKISIINWLSWLIEKNVWFIEFNWSEKMMKNSERLFTKKKLIEMKIAKWNDHEK